MTYSDVVDNFTYFSEELCSRADDALRFSFLLTMQRQQAQIVVDAIFKIFASELAKTKQEENIGKLIVKEVWSWVKKENMGTASNVDTSVLTDLFKGLSLEGRAALGAVDFLGLTAKEAAESLGIKEDEVRAYLVEGRKVLLSRKSDV